MTIYRCDICKVFEYDPVRGNSLTHIAPGTEVTDFPESWRCPICDSDSSHILPIPAGNREKGQKQSYTIPTPGGPATITITTPGRSDLEGYLGDWRRNQDETEKYMDDIHRMSETGESISEPMRTRQDVISWDDILIKGAQLAKIPVNRGETINTRTVIGPDAAQPLVIETPIFISHMSYGALSREVKTAIAKGSAAVMTATGGGEGGVLPEEIDNAYRYIFEYVPNKYSITPELLKRSDAIEIKIGQSAEPGLGAHLPAEKVTEEIAIIRGYQPGTDIISPAAFDDIRTPDDLKAKVTWLRELSGGRPIGIKLAAGHIEADLAIAVFAQPDFITIDGRPGATGTAPKYVKTATSVPTIFALYRARKYLDDHKITGISLIITGGLRVSSDFAKALALGADAIAIGTAALMACACQQYRLCHTGLCPVGVSTQNPELRKRLKIDISAKKLENYLRVSTEELRDFARLTGNTDVHHLTISDLCTVNTEISSSTTIEHV